jgi:hypothetical protein
LADGYVKTAIRIYKTTQQNLLNDKPLDAKPFEIANHNYDLIIDYTCVHESPIDLQVHALNQLYYI